MTRAQPRTAQRLRAGSAGAPADRTRETAQTQAVFARARDAVAQRARAVFERQSTPHGFVPTLSPRMLALAAPLDKFKAFIMHAEARGPDVLRRVLKRMDLNAILLDRAGAERVLANLQDKLACVAEAFFVMPIAREVSASEGKGMSALRSIHAAHSGLNGRGGLPAGVGTLLHFVNVSAAGITPKYDEIALHKSALGAWTGACATFFQKAVRGAPTLPSELARVLHHGVLAIAGPKSVTGAILVVGSALVLREGVNAELFARWTARADGALLKRLGARLRGQTAIKLGKLEEGRGLFTMLAVVYKCFERRGRPDVELLKNAPELAGKFQRVWKRATTFVDQIARVYARARELHELARAPKGQRTWEKGMKRLRENVETLRNNMVRAFFGGTREEGLSYVEAVLNAIMYVCFMVLMIGALFAAWPSLALPAAGAASATMYWEWIYHVLSWITLLGCTLRNTFEVGADRRAAAKGKGESTAPPTGDYV